MNVLHVITSLSNGGAQAVLFNLIRHDTSNRHCVICLSTEGKYTALLSDLGIDVWHLNIPRGKLHITAIPKLFKLVKTLNPDAVQTWMYHADLIGGLVVRAAGISNIVWGIHHSSHDKAATAASTRLVVKLLTWLSYLLPKKIISCSQKGLDLHIVAGYCSSRITFVANGYDLDNYKPGKGSLQNLDTIPVIEKGHKILVNVARWDPQKDHCNLVDACEILVANGIQNFSCLLVGPGVNSDNAELQNYIKQKNLEKHVFLCGISANVAELMNHADLNILPSSFGEAFPNVVAEAMACGVPCVVTDVGDASNMVGENGWVVPPRNAVALSDAMSKALTLIDTPDAWQNLKRACRKTAVSHFDIQSMILGYQKIWSEP